MTQRDLLIIGAGGLAREVAEAVYAAGAAGQNAALRGFLDDDDRLWGTSIAGVPIVGPPELAHQNRDASVIVCVGRPDAYESRRDIVRRLGLQRDQFATVIHPAAAVGSSCRIGNGSVVLADSVLTADVRVGDHVVVMPHVVLTHDVRVNDFATLASGARVGGGAQLGEGVYVGSGACLREKICIGDWSMIGMGSVVLGDVPDRRVWFGNPARDRRQAPIRHHDHEYDDST